MGSDEVKAIDDKWTLPRDKFCSHMVSAGLC